MTTQQINEGFENDMILGKMLVEEFKQAKHQRSLNKVCDDLGIEVIAWEHQLNCTARDVNTLGSTKAKRDRTLNIHYIPAVLNVRILLNCHWRKYDWTIRLRNIS